MIADSTIWCRKKINIHNVIIASKEEIDKINQNSILKNKNTSHVVFDISEPIFNQDKTLAIFSCNYYIKIFDDRNCFKRTLHLLQLCLFVILLETFFLI